MDKNYDDIIDMPHHVSAKRKHMSMTDRAAQFSPFAALTGYDDVVSETARLTSDKPELDETEIAEINRKLAELQERINEQPQVMVTYFVPDKLKAGGKYVTVTDKVKKIQPFERLLILTDGSIIPFGDIMNIEFMR